MPPQLAREAGSDTLRIAGRRNESFCLVLWLHDGSIFDDGTDLAPGEYDVPLASFQPVARVLSWLNSPWKLERSDDAAG